MEYIKIRCEDLTAEQLETDKIFFWPPHLGPGVFKVEGGYHMPFPSGLYTLEEALKWCNSQPGHFWVNYKTEEECLKLLSDPVWKNATRGHLKPKFQFSLNKFYCACCDGFICYGESNAMIDFDVLICSSCVKCCECEKE